MNINQHLLNNTLISSVEYDSGAAGNYLIPPNAKLLQIEGQGAGGGGGGSHVFSSNNSRQATGAGGNSGGYVNLLVYLDSNSGVVSVPYSVGKGGKGSLGYYQGYRSIRTPSGSDGGDTSFGDLVTVAGGKGGLGGYVAIGPNYFQGTRGDNVDNVINRNWRNHFVDVIIDIPTNKGGNGAVSPESDDNNYHIGQNPPDMPGILPVGQYPPATPGTNDWALGGAGAASWTGTGGNSGTPSLDSDEVHGKIGLGHGSGGGAGSSYAGPPDLVGDAGPGAGGFLRIKAYSAKNI